MMLQEIADNGIVGAGGAGFPAQVKLATPVDYLIMNAAECEPLLHKDKELLKQHTDTVLEGFQAAIEQTRAQTGIIAIKEKYADLIEQVSRKITYRMSVEPIGDFYPAGDEVTLIYATTGRVVQPGALPSSVGCAVQNVETLFNIGSHRPVTHKYLTIAGAVSEPLTVRVPIGISFADIIGACEITVPRFSVIVGGLMMGYVETDFRNVVTKRTGGIIILPADHAVVKTYARFSTPAATDRIAKAGCDQCGFCTELCPRYLLGHPVRPETAMRNRMFTMPDAARTNPGSAFCCECNLCTLFSCPEGLDPRGAAVIEKKLLREAGKAWEGLPVAKHPLIDYRKIPTKKLMRKLDVLRYRNEGPLSAREFLPERVRIPLAQHIGAPAKPVVAVDDVVTAGTLIAAANGKISANIHASIDGRVQAVTGQDIVLERR